MKTFWEKLSTYFQYDEQIRRIINTTNPVEGFHRQVRKVTKTKGAFPNDMALLKHIYLATENISKKMDATASELEPYCTAVMH
ncbi:MAG: transposase [Mariniphaga sp.]